MSIKDSIQPVFINSSSALVAGNLYTSNVITTSGVTLTLPTAAIFTGCRFHIVNQTQYFATIATQSGDYIYGDSDIVGIGNATTTLLRPYEQAVFWSPSAFAWNIIEANKNIRICSYGANPNGIVVGNGPNGVSPPDLAIDMTDNVIWGSNGGTSWSKLGANNIQKAQYITGSSINTTFTAPAGVSKLSVQGIGFGGNGGAGYLSGGTSYAGGGGGGGGYFSFDINVSSGQQFNIAVSSATVAITDIATTTLIGSSSTGSAGGAATSSSFGFGGTAGNGYVNTGFSGVSNAIAYYGMPGSNGVNWDSTGGGFGGPGGSTFGVPSLPANNSGQNSFYPGQGANGGFISDPPGQASTGGGSIIITWLQ